MAKPKASHPVKVSVPKVTRAMMQRMTPTNGIIFLFICFSYQAGWAASAVVIFPPFPSFFRMDDYLGTFAGDDWTIRTLR